MTYEASKLVRESVYASGNALDGYFSIKVAGDTFGLPVTRVQTIFRIGSVTLAPGGPLDKIAHAHNVSPGAVALAWLLKRSRVMLPIPGTSKVKHLEENVAAAEITLSDAEYDFLDREGRKNA